LYRSPDFFLVKDTEMGESGGSISEAGGVKADDVHRVVDPQHYGIANPFLACGNEVSDVDHPGLAAR
jgi:hypothetical protein